MPVSVAVLAAAAIYAVFMGLIYLSLATLISSKGGKITLGYHPITIFLLVALGVYLAAVGR